MSKKMFLTHVEEVFSRDVVIQAADNIAAQDKAEELCNCSAINLDGKDFLTRKVTVNGEIPEDEAKKYQVYGAGNSDIDDKKTSAMEAYFSVEESLYKQKDKSIEVKSAMAWGALSVAYNQGAIDWNSMRCLYGEFMSKIMNLR